MNKKKKISLSATKRSITGKRVKILREQKKTPANIYGSHIDSLAITVDFHDFLDVFEQAGETSIIQLQVKEETSPRAVLVSSYQKDPVSGELLHIDFREVDLKEKLTASVPLEHVNQAPAVAIGAVMVTLRDELEVEALPTDFPDAIEVDLSMLKEFGDVITIEDLKYDKDTLTILAEPEDILVKVDEPKEEEEPEEEEPTLDPAAPGQEEGAEGEQPEAPQEDDQPEAEAK